MSGAECRRQRTFPQSKYLSLCIREKPDKGERGEGANRTFAQLPQSATRCRTTMGNMGEESEEKTVGERGERPVFVGFSKFPPFPEGFLLSPVRKQVILISSKQQPST